MIKKYTLLILLSINFLQAEHPTCYNSPYPLTPEQQKFCESAVAFANLAIKDPKRRKGFIHAAIRQLTACELNALTFPNQVKHMEAVIAVILIPSHEALHTFLECTKNSSRDFLSGLSKSMIHLTIQNIIVASINKKNSQTLTEQFTSVQSLTQFFMILAAHGGIFLYQIYKDMHEPLPFLYFDTIEELLAYLQKHNFSMDKNN